MQISFIYIKEYKNIEEQRFNLDGKYSYEFFSAEGRIVYKKNVHYIDQYYDSNETPGPSEILDVTAIIGQNGTGKSTLIEYIGQVFRGWDNFNTAFSINQDLVIARKENELFIFHQGTTYIEKISNEFGSISLPKANYQQVLPESTNLSVATNNLTLKSQILPIYYSTSMHDRFTDLGMQDYDVINISNSYMYYSTNLPVNIDRGRDIRYKRLVSPSNFRSEDIIRQIIFLNETEERSILPKSFRPYEYFGMSVRQQMSHAPEFKELFLVLYQKFEPKNDIEFLRLQILVSVMFGLVYPNANHVPPDSLENYRKLFDDCIERNNSLQELLTNFLHNHPFRNSKTKATMFGREMELYDYKIESKILFSDFIFQNFNEGNFKQLTKSSLENFRKNLVNKPISVNNMFFNPFTYQFKLGFGKKFTGLYVSILEDLTPDFLEFSSSLSSGEVSFLNLFSRFYYGFENQRRFLERTENKEIKKLYQTVLVLIDEAESFFHPQWQKDYFKHLIAFFKQLFKGLRVQLVIASNSPFITSDIPTYDSVFLDPTDDGLSKVSPSSEHNNTLGANIHKLFKDAFYLKNGFMGEFANIKIQEVIDLVRLPKEEYQKVSAEKRTNALKIIENIGEPIIKDKLQEMYLIAEGNDKN